MIEILISIVCILSVLVILYLLGLAGNCFSIDYIPKDNIKDNLIRGVNYLWRGVIIGIGLFILYFIGKGILFYF